MTALKDTADAYRRWQPDVLEQLVTRDATRIPTAAELEAIHQQAHEEGYDQGYQEGMAEGLEAARLEGEEKLAEDLAMLKELLGSMNEAIQNFDQHVSEDLFTLALEISRQMLRQQLKVKPELVLPIVRAAMESLPQNTPHPHLYLHPEDAALVRAGMPSEMSHGAWRIVEDQRITRGGCRIETVNAEIDATIENRWARLTAVFGQDVGWIDE